MRRQPMRLYADGSPYALAQMGPSQTHLRNATQSGSERARPNVLGESARRSQLPSSSGDCPMGSLACTSSRQPFASGIRMPQRLSRRQGGRVPTPRPPRRPQARHPAELLHVLMFPDLERADRIGAYWRYPKTRAFDELLIDREEDSPFGRCSLECCERQTARSHAHAWPGAPV